MNPYCKDCDKFIDNCPINLIGENETCDGCNKVTFEKDTLAYLSVPKYVKGESKCDGVMRCSVLWKHPDFSYDSTPPLSKDYEDTEKHITIQGIGVAIYLYNDGTWFWEDTTGCV